MIYPNEDLEKYQGKGSSIPSPQEQQRLTHYTTTEEGTPGSLSFLPPASKKSINTGPAITPSTASPLPEFDPSKDVITNKVLGDYTPGVLKVKQIDSPEEHRARGGQFFATPDKGGSNFAGYTPSPVPQTASLMPTMPRIDISNPVSIMDAINAMIPYAMQAKRDQAATEREKALSQININKAQIENWASEAARRGPATVSGYEGEGHATMQYSPERGKYDIPVMKGTLPKEVSNQGLKLAEIYGTYLSKYDALSNIDVNAKPLSFPEWVKQFEGFVPLPGGDKGATTGAMNTLPPASQHKGRIIKDTETGKRLRSDGTNWAEVR